MRGGMSQPGLQPLTSTDKGIHYKTVLQIIHPIDRPTRT